MSVHKFYHINLLGNVGTLTTNQVSNCLFYFDWGLLPQSRWNVYITANQGAMGFTVNQQCSINIDLGQNEVDLARGFNGAYAGTSQQDKNIYVACFPNPSNHASNCVFQFGSTANPPIYLDSTPTGNSFIKTLRQTAGNRPLFSPNITTDRVILSFEQLDDPIPRSIKTSYQVVFNSPIGMMGTYFGDYTFYYDWTTIPEGEYLVNMSFITNQTTATEIKYSGNSIFVDLGQANSTVFYASNQANFNVRNKNFVGMTLFSGTNTLGAGATLPIYSNNDTTKPIYLKSRPTNNNVNVLILNDYSPQFILGMITANNPLYNYTLVLNFNLLG